MSNHITLTATDGFTLDACRADQECEARRSCQSEGAKPAFDSAPGFPLERAG